MITKAIWKFPLKIQDKQTLELPFGAEILSVQEQEGQEGLQLWALVTPSVMKGKRDFEIFGTGHPIPCDMGIQRRYIGTAQTQRGRLVWHVFERFVN